MYGLKTESNFDGAHFLTDYYGKCENLHGHRWRVVAYIRQQELGAEGTERDMVLDFGAFKRILREETAKLDHTFLVEEGSLMSCPSARRRKILPATSPSGCRSGVFLSRR